MQHAMLKLAESVPVAITFEMVFVVFVAGTTVFLLMLRASHVASDPRRR